MVENNNENTYYLTSNMGLTNTKIKSRIFCTRANTLYYILNYDKPYVCNNDVVTGMYKSVIFSFPEKEVVCFSPPKSIPYATFTEKYLKNNQDQDNIIVTEVVEGLMINLFYDSRIQSWEIATKNAIGGTYRPNQTNVSIYKMVLAAFAASPNETELNQLLILADLPKDCCYSFVLEALSNRLFLVASYRIHSGYCEMLSLPLPSTSSLSAMIEYPKQYSSTEGLTQYMILNRETGERAKYVKKVKPVKPLYNKQTQYLYLCLRRIHKVPEYLNYFPTQTYSFTQICKHYDHFLKRVLNAYIDMYIHKNIQNKPESPCFAHIYKIHHSIYLPSLKAGCIPTVINKEVVMSYFDKKEPRELLFILFPNMT